MIRVGIISDTHGLVRPEAVEALRGCDQILHAGDVGSPEVLEELGGIAPIRAVRGNIDKGAWADDLPHYDVVEIEDVCVYTIHNLAEMDLEPEAAGFQVVVAGHSHEPKVERKGAVLFLNPGSAGPRRFRLPVAVAILEVDGASAEARIVELAADRAETPK